MSCKSLDRPNKFPWQAQTTDQTTRRRRDSTARVGPNQAPSTPNGPVLPAIHTINSHNRSSTSLPSPQGPLSLVCSGSQLNTRRSNPSGLGSVYYSQTFPLPVEEGRFLCTPPFFFPPNLRSQGRHLLLSDLYPP